MRMLAAALRRNIGDRAFQDLQQRLLHAFARDIAGDRRIFVLAADLVDFVDIDDALLAPLHVAIGGLQQLQDDVLDILTDVARFGQGGGVDNRERHVQNLAPASAPSASCRCRWDRSAECWTSAAPPRSSACGSSGCACSGCRPPPPASSWWLPGRSRTDPETPSLPAAWESCGGPVTAVSTLSSSKNRVADGDALVADVSPGIVAGGRDQLSDYVLALMAKGTTQSIIGSGTLQAIFSCSASEALSRGDSPPAVTYGVGNINRFRLYYHLNCAS